jgi:glyoxylase-like metal-dependent hydrolase (beta-lactamase superfamily II)
MTATDDRLPVWAVWQSRPFPDSNLLLLPGRRPALIDSGFVGDAEETAAWVRSRTRHLALVVNTHWHSDHVGGNALLQAAGAGIAGNATDDQALARRDPGCCAAEYLDQPVSPYTIDMPLHDARVLQLGDADWEVVCAPGHTPGHLSLWQPDERLLVVGDALYDYDFGWVNLALDGPDATATALASLHRLADPAPRVLLPSHGPIPLTPGSHSTPLCVVLNVSSTTQPGAVWHGARRILAYALMIRNGISVEEVAPYLHSRVWHTDAARLLNRTPDELATELVETMLRSGTVIFRGDRLHASAEHLPVAAQSLRVPFPPSMAESGPGKHGRRRATMTTPLRPTARSARPHAQHPYRSCRAPAAFFTRATVRSTEMTPTEAQGLGGTGGHTGGPVHGGRIGQLCGAGGVRALLRHL